MTTHRWSQRVGRNRRFRRAWYFLRQGGLCCLTATQACIDRGGEMQIHDAGRADYATFEHLIPRADMYGAAGEEVGAVQLLACAKCNNAKKRAVAECELVAEARAVFGEYQRVWRALDKAQAQAFACRIAGAA